MKLSKFLPYEKYILETSLNINEVNKRLFENVESEVYSFFPSWKYSYKIVFQGTVWENGFSISRRIAGRNDFSPVSTGAIFTNNGKTYIEVVAKPGQFAIIFMCIWMGFVSLVFIGALLLAILHPSKRAFTIILIPTCMLLFGYGLTMGGFGSETDAPKKFLKELLEATEVTAL